MHFPLFLLTDFGMRDPYVGLMKAATLRRGHRAEVIDLTHEIPRHDIRAGALALEDCLPWLPGGAVVVAVVDPGVGSSRRAIVVKVDGRFHVGPDNGLLTAALELPGARTRVITPGGRIAHPSSNTFHGRDLFAPVGALLASGQMAFEEVGPEIHDPVKLPLSGPPMEVVSVDCFGNLATNFRRVDCAEGDEGVVFLGGVRIGAIRRTFSDAPPGSAVAYFNSFGRLEIAINQGDAAEFFNAQPGTPIEVRPRNP